MIFKVTPKGRPLSQQWRTAIALAAAAGFLLRMLLALYTYGTNDVATFERVMWYSHYFGVGAYALNWDWTLPPSMLHVLRTMGWLERVTGVPFPFWARLPGILADAGSMWIVWKLWSPRGGSSTAWALLWMAASPVSIMVSGFHGDVNAELMFFLLLAVWLAESEAPAWASGAALGLSLCFKIPAIITIPAFLLHLRTNRRRVEFLTALAAVILTTGQPYLLQDPKQLMHNVLGYRSAYGQWGFSYLMQQWATWEPGVQRLNAAFQTWGAYLLLGACSLAALWMHRLKERPRLFSQVGLLFLLFMSLSNGFGVQYMAWLVPWVVGLGGFAAGLYNIAAGLFVFGLYNYWAGGMPWYFAMFQLWSGYLTLFHLLAWLAVILMLWIAWRQMRDHPSAMIVPSWAGLRAKRYWPLVAGISVGLAGNVIVGLVTIQKTSEPRHAELGPARTRGGRGLLFADISGHLYRSNRYPEAIEAATEALRSGFAIEDAYAYRGAAQAALGNWDAAASDSTLASILFT